MRTGNLVWSINTLFAMHMDMKSHTGYSLTMGQGAMISGILKQKLTTRTAESYGIYDTIPFVTWCRLFFCEQVEMIEDDGRAKKKQSKC